MRLDKSQSHTFVFISNRKDDFYMSSEVIICIAIVVVCMSIWFIQQGIEYRIKCKKNGLEFKYNFGMRLFMYIIVTLILALLELIPFYLIKFGNWLIRLGIDSTPIQDESFIEYIVFIPYGCLIIIGLFIVLISALMAIVYLVSDLYCIWYFFVKPEIKHIIEIDKDEIEEVKEEDNIWKEI